MDITVRQAWGSTGGTSGALGVVELRGVCYTSFYVDCSTLATTNSVSLQSAQASSGPWFAEASTQLSTAASTQYRMQVTGPIGPFVRPYLHTVSTGEYHLLLLGVG